ncbi:MAG: hypothetical protein AAFQ80_02315 [Cyanobacteria bacterium J06621_8]
MRNINDDFDTNHSMSNCCFAQWLPSCYWFWDFGLFCQRRGLMDD